MGGKTSTSTSSVQVPQEVLARYSAVNDSAQAAASTPFQAYSSDPNAFVAPLSATQQAGIQNTNTAAGQAQPYYGVATKNLLDWQGNSLGVLGASQGVLTQAQQQASPYYSQATDALTGAQANAAPYYGAATNTLTNAQQQANPYYGAANAALYQGRDMAQTAYGQSYDALNSGYNNASALQTPAQGLAVQGTQAVNATPLGADQINQFMNPYLSTVLGSTSALLNQNNQQAMAGQLGNAISSGAFGGDRAGIAAANLNQQQNLANANIYSGIASQAYNNALGAAQQQQGVNLGAAQANRAALQEGSNQLAGLGQQAYNEGLGASQQLASNAQGLNAVDAGLASGLTNVGNSLYNVGSNTSSGLANLGQGVYGLGANTAAGLANLGQGVYGLGSNTATGLQNIGQGEYNIGAGTSNSLAGLGAGAQSAALQGATAQLTAGQQEQATQQAGLTSLYNQFLQQQAYPFQTAQFLANVAEGTGSLSGSTTTSTQPTGLFGNLLSDRRAKEDIKEVGRAKNGLKIYTFRYKGDPEKVTHLGFMADEVEKKHPEAVGLAGGLKTVDYERAARADGGGLVFDPNAGEYGLGAAGMPGRGTYVPAPVQSAARHIMFQANPPAMKTNSGGLGAVADDYKQIKSLYNDGSQLWNDGKKFVSGLSDGTYSHGGLALKRDYGGPIDDPFQSDADLVRRQRGLAAGEHLIENAPNNAANGPVSGALSAQDNSPRYQLNAAPQAKSGGNSNGLGQLAGLASLASNVSPYILGMFGLKDGGLVPREHHADGDIVGDDNINPHGDAPVDTPASPAQMYDRERASGLAGMMGRGLPSNYQPSGADVPTPPRRPEGLGITPDDVRALPDFKMPDELKPWHGSNYGEDQGLNEAPASRQATGLAASPWRAPAYTGPRPSEAPNPANYGTDQAGQTAFIRDYATYKGIDPRFALGVANAEGLRAIGPNNPNGASTVDIDPNTGKPFSFGAFQLNVRNGLGNVAKAHGIDPTNPAHANIANQFALDQMAEGGLKPWRGDAAVRAYQGGQGMNAGLGAAAPQAAQAGQQPGGLMGSLTSFFHGNPDGQTSPNGGMGERALMAVLSGLGAVGSYKGQSPLGAILQGLGAGAHGWIESGKQQADIARTQAGTGLLGAETGTQQATTMDVRQGLMGKAKWLDPYGQMWVHTADDRIMTEDQWNRSGRPALYGQGLGSTVPLPSLPTAPAGAAPTAVPPPASAAGPAVTPPSPEKPPAIPFGVNMPNESIETAKHDIDAMKGPNFDKLKEQSAAYPQQVKQGLETSQATSQYTQELAKLLNQSYNSPESAKAGALFGTQAALARMGNSIERYLGMKETFTDGDTLQEIQHKIAALRGTMASNGAGQRSLGALDELMTANPNFSQNPKASSALVSQMLADEVKARDMANHAQAYGQISRGSYFNAANDFAKYNGPQKYNKERDEFQRLLLTTKPETVQKLFSGKYSPDEIRKQLRGAGYPEELARWFSTEG